MFTGLQPPGTIQMGERNVHAAREALHRHGIRLTGVVVGGDYGRSVELDLESGRVKVTSYQHGTTELRLIPRGRSWNAFTKNTGASPPFWPSPAPPARPKKPSAGSSPCSSRWTARSAS